MTCTIIGGRAVPYDPARHGPRTHLVPDPDTGRAGSRDVQRLVAFLEPLRFTTEHYWASYPSWARGEACDGGWMNKYSGLGGTYTMQAICWYQHIHRPGTRVCRSRVILTALVRHVLVTDEAPPVMGGVPPALSSNEDGTEAQR